MAPAVIDILVVENLSGKIEVHLDGKTNIELTVEQSEVMRQHITREFSALESN